MRLRVKLLLGALALVLVLVAGVVLFISLADPNDYRGTVAGAVERATGRELRIGGDLHIKLLPFVSVEANDVSFANAPWASQADMLRIRRVHADVALLPLLRGRVLIRQLELIDPQLHLQTNAERRGNWVFADESAAPAAEAAGAAAQGETTVIVANVRIENASIDYLDGVNGRRTKLDIAELGFDGGLPLGRTKLELRASFQDLPVALEGTLGSGEAIVHNRPVEVNLKGHVGEAQFSIEGPVDKPLQGRDMRLTVEVQSPSTKAISDAAGVAVEELGPLGVKLALIDEDGHLSIDALEARAQVRGEAAAIGGSLRDIAVSDASGAGKAGDQAMKVDLKGSLGNAHLTIAGELGHPLGAAGARLQVSADAESTQALSRLAGVELEEMGPLRLSLNLLGQGRRFDVDDIALQARVRKTDARVSGSLTGLSLDQDASKPAKVSLEGALGEATFTLAGEVARPLEGKDLRLNLALDAESTRSLSTLAGVDVEELGPLKLTLTVVEGDGRLDLDAIKLTARPRRAHLSVAGTVRDVLANPQPQLDVAMTAKTLHQLDARLSEAGPVNVAASVRPAGKRIEIRKLTATAGKSDLSGKATLDTSGKRPRADAELHSKLIDLKELLPAEKPAEADAAPAGKDDGRIFSAEPLPLDKLKLLDANIALGVERLLGRKLAFEKVDVKARLENGNLSLEPAAAVAGGTLKGAFDIDARTQPAKFSVDVSTDKLSIGTLSKELRGFETSKGLETNMKLKLSSEGDSLRALMGGLDGDIRVDIGPGEINNTVLDQVGADLLTRLVSVAVPSGEKSKTTAVKCGVVRFAVTKGDAVADQTLVLETAKVLLKGGGLIDLKSEKLDLGAHLAARKGINLSAGTLSSLVRVQGTLAKPRLGTDLKGVVQTGAKVGIAVVTGGLSLLAESVYGQVSEDEHPCQTALARKIEAKPDTLKALFK